MYQAQFFKAEGLHETDVGALVGLRAVTLDKARHEALALTRPAGSNFVKIVSDGRVVSKLGFAL
jgi:hypothetical protein